MTVKEEVKAKAVTAAAAARMKEMHEGVEGERKRSSGKQATSFWGSVGKAKARNATFSGGEKATEK